MAELVAIVGAVSAFASLVDLCIKVTKSLNELREDFVDAIDALKSVRADVEAFGSILRQIANHLEERQRTGGERCRRATYEHLLRIALNCATPLLGLQAVLSKFENYSDLEGRGRAIHIPIIRMRLRWIMEQKKILKIQQGLEKQKSTLNTQLLVILVTGDSQNIQESPVQRIEQADLATTQAVEDIAPPSAEELAAAVPVLCQPRGLPEAAPGNEAAGSQRAESQQAESQLTEVVAAGVQAAGVEAAESQPTGGQPTESQPAESQPAESQPADSQAADSQAADSQATDTEPQLPQQQQQQLQQQPSSASLPQQPQSHTPKPRRIPLRLSNNAIFSAIASGDNAILLRVLQSGVELVTERASDGSTPLQAAVLHNHEEIVVTLLFFRADPNAGGGYYRSPLLAAISRERPRLVKILLEAGADPSAPGVIQAAAEKNLEILRLCLAKYDPFEYNIDINSFHPSGPGAINGKTPLVAACVTGNVDVVRFLLEEAHADPTVMFPGDCVPELRSALHVSVMRQNEVLLALLLSFIPDPNVCNDITHGPGLLLHCAVNTGNANIVETLLRAGVDPNVSVPIFGTALQVACKGAALDIVECLLRHNADPNVAPPGLHPIEQICNPLHAAASVGSIAMLDMLLSHGADVRRGGGVLWVATSHAHLDVMRRLLEMDGVDINEIWRTPGYDVTRGMPLHCAAGMGNAELVKFLLDHGADPNVSTSFLGTPLDVALKSKHHKCVEELLGDGQ